MARSSSSHLTIKVYHGYGHTHDLLLYGHVFKKAPHIRSNYSNNVLINAFQLIRMFFVKPVARVKVQLLWRNQVIDSETEDDGFFKFEWKSDDNVSAGWHHVVVRAIDHTGTAISVGGGKMFVPHITQYAFVSDIDDTILISYSSTVFKRLKLLFTKNPHTRKTFDHVSEHYNLLAYCHTETETPNPFFYVSSSEWNLYNDLNDFFKFNQLPSGAFLLSQLKRWFELWKTGKTKHEAKLLRIIRILEAFPNQQFILFGDNTQSDPSIYAAIAKKYPEKIFAVYIRNVVSEHEALTRVFLKEMEDHNVYTCLFRNSLEAIGHSKVIGLVQNIP